MEHKIYLDEISLINLFNGKKIASVKELSRSDGDVIRITKIERLKL
jgi:hypothetical protein